MYMYNVHVCCLGEAGLSKNFPSNLSSTIKCDIFGYKLCFSYEKSKYSRFKKKQFSVFLHRILRLKMVNILQKIVKPIKLSESGFILILIIIHILKVYLSKTKNNSLNNIMLYVYTCSIKGTCRLEQKLETMECLFNKL